MLGQGNDQIFLPGGSWTGNILGEGGNDTFTLSGGMVVGELRTDGSTENENDGSDTIIISGGSINGDIYLNGGNDTVTITAGTSTSDIYGKAGDDGFTWSGGELNCGFYGGTGSDTASISAADYDGHQIFDGGDDTGTADGYIDTLTISGVTATANGSDILNWEKMNINGSSMNVNGTLAVGDGSVDTGVYLADSSVLDGNLDIDSSSSFIGRGGGSGVYTISHNLSNAGTIDTLDGKTGDTVVVGGNYSGNGTLRFDTDFSTGTTDSLIITNSVVINSGTIEINNVSASPSATAPMTIALIELPNDSDRSDENYVLAEPNRYNGESTLGKWKNSPYIWKLGISGDNWVLGAAETENGQTAVSPEIPAEVSLPTFSYEVSINKLNTLHQRLGELRRHSAWANFDPTNNRTSGIFPPVSFDDNHLNAWIRSTYAGFNVDADETFEVEGRYGLAQLGFDYKLGGERNTIYTGFYGSYIQGDYDNAGKGGEHGTLIEASTDVDGWSVGIYGTWMNSLGTYVDLVADYMHLDADIETVENFSTTGDTISGSFEAGQSFAVKPKLILEPQLQVKLAHVTWDGFNDGYNDVSFEDHTYVTGRAGLRTEYTFSLISGFEIKPWLYVGAQHEFTGSPIVTNVIDFKTNEYDTTGNVQAGLTWEIGNLFRLYLNGGYTTDFNIYDAWRGDFGFRIQF